MVAQKTAGRGGGQANAMRSGTDLRPKKTACFVNRSRPLMDERCLNLADLPGLRLARLRLALLTLVPLKLVPAMCELVAEHSPDTESIHDKILQFDTLTNICRAIAQRICHAVVIDVIKRLGDPGQDHKVVAAKH